eukprot:TRINITY_DN10082_c0_g1_i1.p1 TRINITY_DN10082_c0_g1~~TRINITY_DN10082_c0_g1_i1.p1  ORF type:complete len:806 (+),score=206.38 TRINITY_DN10082_c0_g1_i1:32-2449(+)
MVGGRTRSKSRSIHANREGSASSAFTPLEARCVSPPRGKPKVSREPKMVSKSPPRVEKLPPPSSPRFASPIVTRRMHSVETWHQTPPRTHSPTPAPQPVVPSPAPTSVTKLQPQPQPSGPSMEQRFNTLQHSLQSSLQNLENQVQTLTIAVEQRPREPVVRRDESEILKALKEELQKDSDGPHLNGPYSTTCRTIKTIIHRNVAKQLADWADLWEERGNASLRRSVVDIKNEYKAEIKDSRLQEHVQALQERVTGVHHKIADSERRCESKLHDLQKTCDDLRGKIQSLEAAGEKASEYNDDVWHHLKEVSAAMEKGLKNHSADMAMEMETMKVTMSDASSRVNDLERAVKGHDDILASRDMREMGKRVKKLEDSYCDARDLTQLRDETKMANENINHEIGDLEARLLRQIGQENTKKRMLEDRLAKLELEQREDSGLRHVIEAVRQEFSEGEASYRRRLDAQDKQIREIKRATDGNTINVHEAADACSSLKRQLQDLQEGAFATGRGEVRPVSDGVPRHIKEDIERIKKQVTSNTTAIHEIRNDIEDLQDTVASDSARIDSKVDSHALSKAAAENLQKAVDTVRRTLIGTLDRRVTALEEGGDTEELNERVSDVEAKVSSLLAKPKQQGVDRKALEKYDELFNKLYGELYETRDTVEQCQDSDRAMGTQIKKFMQELQSLQRDVKRGLEAHDSEIETVQKGVREVEARLETKINGQKKEQHAALDGVRHEMIGYADSKMEEIQVVANSYRDRIQNVSDNVDKHKGQIDGLIEDKAGRFSEQRSLITDLEKTIDIVRRQVRDINSQ